MCVCVGNIPVLLHYYCYSERASFIACHTLSTEILRHSNGSPASRGLQCGVTSRVLSSSHAHTIKASHAATQFLLVVVAKVASSLFTLHSLLFLTLSFRCTALFPNALASGLQKMFLCIKNHLFLSHAQ